MSAHYRISESDCRRAVLLAGRLSRRGWVVALLVALVLVLGCVLMIVTDSGTGSSARAGTVGMTMGLVIWCGAALIMWPRQVKLFLWGVAALVLWVAFTIVMGVDWFIIWQRNGWGLMFGLPLYWLLLYFQNRNLRRKYQTLHREWTVTLQVGGLYLVSPEGQGLLAWEQIRKWRWNADDVLIYSGSPLFLIVPVAATAEQGFNVERLKTALTQHVGPPEWKA